MELTPSYVEAALRRAEHPDHLASQLRDWFGADALKTGPDPKIEETTAVWALEVPDATPDTTVRVLADDGSFKLSLSRLGGSNLFAAAASLQPGTAFRWNYEVVVRTGDPAPRAPGLPPEWGSLEATGERRYLLPDVSAEAATRIRGRGRPFEVYATHPDSRARDDVPHGRLESREKWRSRVIEGTTRDWWYYVPAQHEPSTGSCVMIFQDGQWYTDFVPPVFDNLIAQGDMPPTVAVFIAPGVFDDGKPNRSVEYDTLSDHYARFLLEEILPGVEKDVRLKQDPESRAISGISSGGICAFTAAWERPDAFHKVLSWVGSFTDIRGGHAYPSLIRKTPPKPIRVFLQDGKNDLDVAAGDWWLANLTMASALEYAGYDYTAAWGDGFHSNKHGRAILPDSLRWLWRGYGH